MRGYRSPKLLKGGKTLRKCVKCGENANRRKKSKMLKRPGKSRLGISYKAIHILNLESPWQGQRYIKNSRKKLDGALQE